MKRSELKQIIREVIEESSSKDLIGRFRSIEDEQDGIAKEKGQLAALANASVKDYTTELYRILGDLRKLGNEMEDGEEEKEDINEFLKTITGSPLRRNRS